MSSLWLKSEGLIHAVRGDIESSVEGLYPTKPYVACVFRLIANQIGQNGGTACVHVLAAPLGEGYKPFLSLMRKTEIDKGKGLCYLTFACASDRKGYFAVKAGSDLFPAKTIAVLPVEGGSFLDGQLTEMSRMVNRVLDVAARSPG